MIQKPTGVPKNELQIAFRLDYWPSLDPNVIVFSYTKDHFKWYDPRSRVQWKQAILLVESYKLNARPLDEGSRPKSSKLRLILYVTILEGKSIRWNQK